MTRTIRWLAATALATAGFTVFAAGGVSADTDADVDDEVDQDADAHVGVFQKAWSNSGHNLAVN